MSIPSSLKLIPSKPTITVEHIQLMTDQQLESYLTHFSDEELRQARELWKEHAARKELINFEASHAKTIRL